RGTGEFVEGNLRSVDPQAPLSPLATPLTASAVPRPPGKTRLSHGNPPPSGVGRKSTAVPAATRWPSPRTPSPSPPRPPRPYPATMPTRTSPPAALVRYGTCQHHPSTSGAATLPLTQRAPSRGCRRHPGQTGGDPTAKGQLNKAAPTGRPGHRLTVVGPHVVAHVGAHDRRCLLRAAGDRPRHCR